MVAVGGAIPQPDLAPVDRSPAAFRASLVADLASGLAHEVRNPLNAMSIHLEVLADKIRTEHGEIPGHLIKNLEGVRAQIGRVDEIVRRFAEFVVGRGEAGPSDVGAQLASAHALCEHPFKFRGVYCTVTAPAGLRVSLAAGNLQHLLVACLLTWGRALGRGGILSVIATTRPGLVTVVGEATQLEEEPAAGEVLALAAGFGVDFESGRSFTLRLQQTN